MKDYLTQYAATTRQKVDMDLARRYDYDMRRDGDKSIKALMSKVRRVATGASNLLVDFHDLPGPKAKEISSSAQTLRELADSFEGLARFAKGYHAYYLAELQKEHVAAVESLALARWGTDEAACELEWLLLEELYSKEGRRELGRWMHAQGLYTEVDEGAFYTSFKRNRLAGKNRRKEAAETLLEMRDPTYKQTSVNSWGEKSCHIGMIDYERYLQVRKAAAKVSSDFIKGVSSRS